MKTVEAMDTPFLVSGDETRKLSERMKALDRVDEKRLSQPRNSAWNRGLKSANGGERKRPMVSFPFTTRQTRCRIAKVSEVCHSTYYSPLYSR